MDRAPSNSTQRCTAICQSHSHLIIEGLVMYIIFYLHPKVWCLDLADKAPLLEQECCSRLIPANTYIYHKKLKFKKTSFLENPWWLMIILNKHLHTIKINNWWKRPLQRYSLRKFQIQQLIPSTFHIKQKHVLSSPSFWNDESNIKVFFFFLSANEGDNFLHRWLPLAHKSKAGWALM
jgi:hypothetical protein